MMPIFTRASRVRARRARRRIPSPPRKSVEPRLALGAHRRASSALHTDPPSERACRWWREGPVLGVICDQLFVPRGPANSRSQSQRPRPPLERFEPRFTLWVHLLATRALISNPVPETWRGWWRHLSVIRVIRAQLVEPLVPASVHSPRPPLESVEPRFALGVHCRATLALIGYPPAEPSCHRGWRDPLLLFVIRNELAESRRPPDSHSHRTSWRNALAWWALVGVVVGGGRKPLCLGERRNCDLAFLCELRDFDLGAFSRESGHHEK